MDLVDGIHNTEEEINVNTVDNMKDLNNSNESYTLDLNTRTKRNKNMDLNAFYKKSRHFFIMTDGGKPVYFRYGNESENCELVAFFSAIIVKFTHFSSTETFKEKIQ
jgi:hypothetical protein